MCETTAIVAGVMAVVSAAGAFVQSEQQRVQQQAAHKAQSQAAQQQAMTAMNNAQAMRQQADIELQKGEVNKRRVDMDRDRLRRGYEQQAGANRSLLASGFVDISSGSAADSLLANADLFGEDMALNRYNWTLADWEANENARQARWQADQFAARGLGYRRQASWLGKSAGGIGDSLLSAGIAGLTAFGTSYIGAGMPGLGGTGTSAFMPYAGGTNAITPYMAQYGRGNNSLIR